MSSDEQNFINAGHANSTAQEKRFTAAPVIWTVGEEFTDDDEDLIIAAPPATAEPFCSSFRRKPESSVLALEVFARHRKRSRQAFHLSPCGRGRRAPRRERGWRRQAPDFQKKKPHPCGFI